MDFQTETETEDDAVQEGVQVESSSNGKAKRRNDLDEKRNAQEEGMGTDTDWGKIVNWVVYAAMAFAVIYVLDTSYGIRLRPIVKYYFPREAAVFGL